MDSLANHVGIDVSQLFLETRLPGRAGKLFTNDIDGILSLISELPNDATVQLEATGGYDRLVRQTLSEHGFTAHRHNARKVRRMADALGVSAKTDAIDSRLLVTVGPLLKPPIAKSPEKEALCDLSLTIGEIQKHCADYQTRLSTPQLDPAAKKAMEDILVVLRKQIAALETQFVKRIKKSVRYSDYKLLLSVPSIGAKTARVILSELPDDLSGLSSSQICSYAGIAPMDDSSGKRNKPKRIKPGNMHLKACLYMPAIGSIGRYAWARDLYARLVAKGREHEQAIVAVMRRLLRHAVAVLKRKTPWEMGPTIA